MTLIAFGIITSLSVLLICVVYAQDWKEERRWAKAWKAFEERRAAENGEK